MKTIHKYKLDIVDEQVIDLPSNNVPLSAQFQHDQLCLWALVETDSPKEKVRFRIFGTGHPIPEHEYDSLEFFATVQQGQFVWHIFIDPYAVAATTVKKNPSQLDKVFAHAKV